MAVSASTLAKRASYIQSAYKGYRSLGTQNFTLGSTVRFKLDPIGLVVSLYLEVVAVVNISGAAAVLSQQAPYNLITRVMLQDTNGTARVNAPATHVWTISSVWRGKPDFRQAGVMFNSPTLPTQVGNNQVIRFNLNVPVSFSEIDLRGALQTGNNIDQYLQLDIASSLIQPPAGQNDHDIFYIGAAGTTVTLVSGYINAMQRYYAASGNVQPPADDLATVHYIEGQLRITDGLAPNTERVINYPVNRSTNLVSMRYSNAGVMQHGDTSRIRQLSGPTEILSLSEDNMLAVQRDILGGTDLPWNYFFFRHDRELATPYSNANQIGFTPTNAGAGNTYLSVCFESFGTK